MIARIKDVYVRRYSDSGQITLYVEWTDTDGKDGRTEGQWLENDHTGHPVGWHMEALLNRARCEGFKVIRRETW